MKTYIKLSLDQSGAPHVHLDTKGSSVVNVLMEPTKLNFRMLVARFARISLL